MPSGALAEMLAADGELDRIVGGYGLSFERTPAPAVPAPPPFEIPRPDWDAEEADQRRRDAVAAIREPDPPRPYREDEQRLPARPARRALDGAA